MIVKLREAENKDFKRLLELNNEWYKEGVSPGAVKESEYSFRKEYKKSTFFVAEHKGEVIGFLKCRVRVSPEENRIHNIKEGEKYVDLDSIFVTRKFRNKGIGTKLMKHFLSEIKRVGYRKVILSADNKNLPRLVKFYEKHGFKILFTRMMQEL